MKLLTTGFAPFGGERINPAWEAVRRLPDRMGEAELIKAEMPTSFAGCAAALEEACRLWRPDGVLCVGQAGGRACVTVERVAINLAEASIPDNDTAGTYVCNCLMYRALHLAAEVYPGMRAGFIHVPYALRQAADKPGSTPSMSLEAITAALAAAIEAAALGQEDLGTGMGTTH